MRKEIDLIWHSLRYSYNVNIIRDCLCSDMKAQIAKKIDYHTAKIKELKAIK